jgi:hypothetical protein
MIHAQPDWTGEAIILAIAGYDPDFRRVAAKIAAIFTVLQS